MAFPLPFITPAPLFIPAYTHWLYYFEIRISPSDILTRRGSKTSRRCSTQYNWGKHYHTLTNLTAYIFASVITHFSLLYKVRHQGLNAAMAHRLLHKLSFTRKHSGPTTPTIYAGISPGTAVVPPSQDPTPSSSAVISTSPTAYPRYSNPPIPLVDFPPPDFRPSSGSRRPRQSVNLFKKLLGKQQPAPPRVTAPRSRSRNTWEKELQEFRFDDDAGARDGNSKDGSPKVKTPTSWELHWDCAKTE